MQLMYHKSMLCIIQLSIRMITTANKVELQPFTHFDILFILVETIEFCVCTCTHLCRGIEMYNLVCCGEHYF